MVIDHTAPRDSGAEEPTMSKREYLISSTKPGVKGVWRVYASRASAERYAKQRGMIVSE